MIDLNKKIEIGSLTLDFPFFLAPMAGVTDYAYRVIAKEFGAGIVYSEFVSAHGIIRKNEKTLKMIEFSNFERPILPSGPMKASMCSFRMALKSSLSFFCFQCLRSFYTIKMHEQKLLRTTSLCICARKQEVFCVCHSFECRY